MTGEHPKMAPELQLMAQRLLAVLDPLIAAGVAFATPATAEPGKCQQVWCLVCAFAAAAAGEQHPLSALIAEHGETLLGLIRAMAGSTDSETSRSEDHDGDTDRSPGAATRYQPIPVTVYE